MKHKPIDDPEILAFVARTEEAYPADSNVGTVAENRRNYDAMCAVFRQPRPASIRVEDTTVGAVPVRRYVPENVDPLRPAILYAHGGGFVVGGLDSHDDVCAEMAEATGMAVTAVDYRLAPEHAAPAHLDDVETVWRFMARNNPRLIAAGDSAGGNLAAGLSLRMRRLGGPMPIAQVLIYPGLGGNLTWLSYVENAEAPLLRTSDLAAYRTISPGLSLPQHEIEERAPLKAASFAGLPPAYIFTADVDPVRDDGVVYAERLRASGVRAELRNDEQLVHGYLRGRVMSRRIAEAFAAICAGVRNAAEA
jgi:acetyl esterase